jgi:hypothetical protein
LAKLPWAPPSGRLASLGVRPAELLTLREDDALWRLHRTHGEHVVAWNLMRRYGPVTSGRFDPHEPPPREQVAGVLYAAGSAQTCVAEVFQNTRRVNRWRGVPFLTLFCPTRMLRLVDLCGPWPTRAGASQALASGRRDVARSWARSIRMAFPELDGVAYPSSMDGGAVAYALFDPAADALPAAPAGSWPLSHPALAEPLAAAAHTLGYGLL